MKIGEHEITLEEPDLICLRVVGDFSREETLAMFEVIEPFAQGKPHLLWLTDLRRARNVDSAQRRLFVQCVRALPVRANAFVGGAAPRALPDDGARERDPAAGRPGCAHRAFRR